MSYCFFVQFCRQPNVYRVVNNQMECYLLCLVVLSALSCRQPNVISLVVLCVLGCRQPNVMLFVDTKMLSNIVNRKFSTGSSQWLLSLYWAEMTKRQVPIHRLLEWDRRHRPKLRAL